MEILYLIVGGGFKYVGKVKEDLPDKIILEDAILLEFAPNPKGGIVTIPTPCLPNGLVINEISFNKTLINYIGDGTELYKNIKAALNNIALANNLPSQQQQRPNSKLIL